MTLLGNFVRTREQGEKSISWRSMNDMNGMRSSSRAISFLMRTPILASHGSFTPFVLYERIIFSLSGHLYKISQQSHEFVVAIKQGGVGVAVRCIAPRTAPGGALCVIHHTATKNPSLCTFQNQYFACKSCGCTLSPNDRSPCACA